LMSVFGEVVVKRLAYGARGRGGECFSARWRSEPAKGNDAHALRERLAFEVERGSF